ncbi:MAG: hypothetical protein QGH20_08650, partial [Candidatus Latescibacteria bacterium]|nr:hypothetical protein [Candidatus Latescibacterota bacterium]
MLLMEHPAPEAAQALRHAYHNFVFDVNRWYAAQAVSVALGQEACAWLNEISDLLGGESIWLADKVEITKEATCG